MADPILLCVNNPLHRPRERQPAMDALRVIEVTYSVTYWPALKSDDYSRGLSRYWTDPRVLINIEHDMAPTTADIQALLDCPHPRCAFTYWIAPASHGSKAAILSGVPDPAHPPEFAPRLAPGCCKIDPSVRKGQFPIVDWPQVEWSIYAAVGQPWHVHYPPVLHYHGWTKAYYDSLLEKVG